MNKILNTSSVLLNTFICVVIMLSLNACGGTKNAAESKHSDSYTNKIISKARQSSAPEPNYDHIMPAADSSLKYNDSIFYKGVLYNNTGQYDEALKLLTHFSKLHPNISATYFQIARSHIGNNSSLELINQFITQAYELEPENKWYMMYYAELISMKGENLQAANIFNELIEKGNYDKEIFMKAYINYTKAEAYDSLFSLIKKIDQYTDFEDEYIEKLTITVHQMNNDTEIVEKMLLNKIENNDSSISDKLALLKFYIESEQLEKKQNLLSEINYFNLDTENQDVLLSELILSYDTQSVNSILKEIYIDRVDSALMLSSTTTLVNAWSYSPRSIQPYIKEMIRWDHEMDHNYYVPVFLIGYYQSLEEYDSMIIYSKSAFDKGYMNIRNFTILFYYYYEMKDRDNIDSLISIAIGRNEEYAIAHYAAGLIAMEESLIDEAYQSLHKASEYATTTDYLPAFIAEVYMYLGDLYQQIDNFEPEKVISYYDSSLQYNPDNEVVLNNYAYYLSIIDERLEDAEKMSLKSLDIKPTNPYYLDTYAWIQYKLSNYEVAKEYQLKAFKYSKNPSSVIYEHLGDIEIKLNNIDQAIEYYKSAIKAGGDEKILRQKIAEYEK